MSSPDDLERAVEATLFAAEKPMTAEQLSAHLQGADVRAALAEIGFAGWATAEVGGGDLARLKRVREQMQEAFGV